MNTSMASNTSTAITASTASRSPFFHAHLQEGQRFDEFGQLKSTATRLPEDFADLSSTPRRDTRGALAPSGPAIKTALSLPSNARSGSSSNTLLPHSTISGPKPNTSVVAQVSFKSAPRDTMPSDSSQELFASLVEVPIPSPEGRQYHYLTRSQSSGGGYSPEPTKEKVTTKSLKLSHSNSSSLSADIRDPPSIVPTGHNAVAPAPRNLSPIDEGSPKHSPTFHTAPQADTASIHSTNSGLFINRPVRRTASASSFNSTNSIPPRSAGATTTTTVERDDGSKLPFTYAPTNPPRAAYPRSFSALPVIPASPRESQNVPHDESTDGGGGSIGLKYPQPAALLGKRQDFSGFVTPGVLAAVEAALADADAEEYGTGTGTASNAIGLAIGTPSNRLSVAESVRSAETQYTYLTADSLAQSRRNTMAEGSGISLPNQHHQRAKENLRSPSKLRDLESGLATEDAPQGDPNHSPTIRRLQMLRLSLLAAGRNGMQHFRRSGEKDQAAGDDVEARLDDVRASGGEKKVSGKTKRMGPVALIAHIAFSGMTKRKPSELLFWAGFLAPWCWLIGGWMLRRDGFAVDGGYDERRVAAPTEALAERQGEKGVGSGSRRSARNVDPEGVDERNRYTTATNIAVVPSTRTSISEDRPDSAGARTAVPAAEQEEVPVKHDEKRLRGLAAAWESAKSSSAEILEALRGPRPTDSEDTEATLKPSLAHGSRLSVRSLTRIDPWVARCRVAAVFGALLVIGLCVAAAVELARAF